LAVELGIENPLARDVEIVAVHQGEHGMFRERVDGTGDHAPDAQLLAFLEADHRIGRVLGVQFRHAESIA
jgi:hypothetical protein